MQTTVKNQKVGATSLLAKTNSSPLPTSPSSPSPIVAPTKTRLDVLSDKIAEIESIVEPKQSSSTFLAKLKTIPRWAFISGLTPIITFLLLYVSSPSFVTKTKGKKKLRDISKMTKYTFILTTLVWILQYAYHYYTVTRLAKN